MPRITLQQAITRLEAHYGPPPPHPVTDPWLMVLWENVAYLVDDQRRLAAFNALRKGIGTTPRAILAAPRKKLEAVTGYGILPAQFADKLRDCAQLMLDEFPDGLTPVIKLPFQQAIKALMKFHGIGRPGAEKILLFAKAHPVLALESNGLRVLLRLGYGHEQPNYATTYKLVQEAVAGEVKNDFGWLIAAHEHLRRHGQALCRRSNPQCGKCPLVSDCERVGVTSPLEPDPAAPGS
jgi:endonuclease III